MLMEGSVYSAGEANLLNKRPLSVNAAGELLLSAGFPAAALLANNTAIPTTTMVGAVLMAYDGANLDIMPGTSAAGLNVVADTELPAAAALADAAAVANTPTVGAANLVYNGTNWNFQRGNATGVHLARKKVAVSLTAAAAGDYGAGDIISNSATGDAGVANALPGVVDVAGQTARIVGIIAKCNEDSVVHQLRLHFYDYNPAAADVELDDNAAGDFAKNATGLAGYKGYIDLPAMVDLGTSIAFAQLHNQKFMVATNASTGLWFVVQTITAETNETAGMIFTFDFLIES